MKKITLLFTAMLATVVMEGQTTFQLDWLVGVNGGAASFTLEVGDAVEWTWGDPLAHSVTSMSGSTETFDSGIITGMGTQYTYTLLLWEPIPTIASYTRQVCLGPLMLKPLCLFRINLSEIFNSTRIRFKMN